MLKQDYPRLVPGAATERVAGRVFDLAEYLMRLDGEGKLAREFRGSLGKVAYQAPCHLRVQEIGFKSRDLLRLLPGAAGEAVRGRPGEGGARGVQRAVHERPGQGGR